MGEILKANYDDDALARAKDHYNHTLCKFEIYCSKMIPSLKITTSHLNQLRHAIKQNDKRLEKIEEPIHKEENKKRIIRNSKGPIPKRHTKGSAAYDIETPDMIVLYPGQLYKVNTGVSVELLEGEAGQLIPRSSMVDMAVIS